MKFLLSFAGLEVVQDSSPTKQAGWDYLLIVWNYILYEDVGTPNTFSGIIYPYSYCSKLPKNCAG